MVNFELLTKFSGSCIQVEVKSIWGKSKNPKGLAYFPLFRLVDFENRFGIIRNVAAFFVMKSHSAILCE